MLVEEEVNRTIMPVLATVTRAFMPPAKRRGDKMVPAAMPSAPAANPVLPQPHTHTNNMLRPSKACFGSEAMSQIK